MQFLNTHNDIFFNFVEGWITLQQINQSVTFAHIELKQRKQEKLAASSPSLRNLWALTSRQMMASLSWEGPSLSPFRLLWTEGREDGHIPHQASNPARSLWSLHVIRGQISLCAWRAMDSGSPPRPPAGRAPSVRCMFPQQWRRVRTSALSTPGSNAAPPRCDVEQVTPSGLRSSPLKLEEAIEAGVASRRSTWAPHQPGIEACCFVCWSDGHRQLLSSSLPSSLKWKSLHRFHRGFLWQLNGLMKSFYYDSFCKDWDELILNIRAVPGT